MERRAGARGLAAVLFTDIVGSTAIAAEMGDARWRELIARHHRIVRDLLGRHGGHEVDTAGDGFFATFERPADAIRCAAAATHAVHELGIEIRAGIAFGEVEIGPGKPSGLVVNTASRVMSVAGPCEVLVPGSVKEIVGGAGFAFEDRGSRRLKGLDGTVRLSRLTEIDGVPSPPPLDPEDAAARRRDVCPSRGRRLGLVVGVAAGVLAISIAAVALWGSTGGPGATEVGLSGSGTRWRSSIQPPVSRGPSSTWIASRHGATTFGTRSPPVRAASGCSIRPTSVTSTRCMKTSAPRPSR